MKSISRLAEISINHIILNCDSPCILDVAYIKKKKSYFNVVIS